MEGKDWERQSRYASLSVTQFTLILASIHTAAVGPLKSKTAQVHSIKIFLYFLPQFQAA